jgi:FecR protein
MAPGSGRFLSIAVLVSLSGFTASAQSVVSAKSGVLHLSEGAVFVGDQPVNQQFGTFPDIKEKMVLRTELGRAEVLLTPGVFLRVGENSSIKMIDNRLVDTRVEVLSGQAVVESDDPMKTNAVTIVYKDYQIHVRKAGVMEFQTNPEQLRVFHGEVEVEGNGSVTVVKAGRLMPFSPALASEKFDTHNEGDALTRWSERRSEYVSTANLSAAKSLRDSGSTWGSSGWYYNPYYSMFTYIPMNGMYMNPYGYSFWSPYTVYQVYNNAYYYGGGGGSRTTGTGYNTSTASRNPGFNTSVMSQRPSLGMSSPTFSSPAMSGGNMGGGMGSVAGGGARGGGMSAPAGGGGGGSSSVGGGRGK